MEHRLVFRHLRTKRTVAFLDALGMAFAVMLILLIAGTSPVGVIHDGHQYSGFILLGGLVDVMLAIGLIADLGFLVFNRYTQVRERTRQFALLRTLGASWSFLHAVLMEETLVIAIPATMAGVLLCLSFRFLFTHIVLDTLVVTLRYDLVGIAGLAVAGIFSLAGYAGIRSTAKLDLNTALMRDSFARKQRSVEDVF